jgi:hypothetical protein
MSMSDRRTYAVEIRWGSNLMRTSAHSAREALDEAERISQGETYEVRMYYGPELWCMMRGAAAKEA